MSLHVDKLTSQLSCIALLSLVDYQHWSDHTDQTKTSQNEWNIYITIRNELLVITEAYKVITQSRTFGHGLITFIFNVAVIIAFAKHVQRYSLAKCD